MKNKQISTEDFKKVELSILNRTGEETESLLERIDVEYLHIDIMDGYFVKDLSNISPFLLQNLNISKYKLHLHFMVNDSLTYFNYYGSLKNIDSVSFHVENDFFMSKRYEELIKILKKRNIKVWLVLNPETSINILDNIKEEIDFVMLMSVIPWKGGQGFLTEINIKIKKLFEKYDFPILLDGWINSEICKKHEDRIERFIIGSYLYNNY